MSESEADLKKKIQALEKSNRVLQRQLTQSQVDLASLETSFEKQQALLKRVIQDLSDSQQALEAKERRLELALADLQATQGQLATSERLLKLVIDNIPQRIFWKDQQSVYLGCNQRFANLLGLASPADIVGKTDRDLSWCLGDVEATQADDRRLMTTDQATYDLVQSCTSKEGQQVWLEINKIPLHDAVGNVIGILETQEDITKQKQAELSLQQLNEDLEARVQERTIALQQSQTRFQKLAENVPGMIYQFQMTTDGTVSFPYVSAGCREIYGLEPEQIQQDANSILAIVHPEDLEAFRQSLLVSVQTLQPWQWIGRVMKASGETKWLQAASRPEKLANGDILWDGVVLDVSDRKAAEDALRESKQLLQLIFDTLPQRIFWKDLQSQYLGCNKLFAQDAGMDSPEQLLGLTDFEMPWTDQAALYRADDALVMASGIAKINYEEPQTTPDGSQIWLRTSKLPLRDAKGEIIGVFGSYEDISDVKLAEEALQKSKRQLQAFLDNSPAAIYMKDLEGRYELANPVVSEIFNLPTSEIIGKTDFDLFPASAAELFRENDRQVLETGVTDYLEEVLIHPNDQERIYLVVKFPLMDEEGQPYALGGIATDITDRKAAEQALLDHADRQALLNRLLQQIRNSLELETILENTLRMICDWQELDYCGFAWFRPHTEPPTWEIIQEARVDDCPSFLGTYSTKVLGSASHLLLNQFAVQVEDVQQMTDPVFRRLLKTLGIQSQLVLPIQTRSQQVGCLICSHFKQPMSWTASEVDMVRVVADQLTIAIDQAELYAQSQTRSKELTKILAELQRTQTQMIQSEKMSSLGQLVAGVAHEINNPINFIHGNLSHASGYANDLLALVDLYQQHYPVPVPAIQEQIEDIDLEFLQEDLPKLLASMEIGTDRIRQIVLSLRTFSRMDESEMKAVDIHEGIDSTLMILQHRLKAKDHQPEITVVKDYAELPQVECYAGQLNQVFMNLLSNAIDALEDCRTSGTKLHSKDGTMEDDDPLCPYPQITIQTELLADTVLITIADNGPGIPEAVQKRMFDPFFTTKPIGKGTGMGLSISHQIVTEKHGGTMTCQSFSGQGTEFQIEIPLVQRRG